jgi:hypothetical protein
MRPASQLLIVTCLTFFCANNSYSTEPTPQQLFDSAVYTLSSQPSIAPSRGGSTGIPSPYAIANANASISTNLGSGGGGTSIDLSGNLNKIRLNENTFLSIIAESFQLEQPTASSVSDTSKTVNSKTFQAAGFRLGISNKLSNKLKQHISECCGLVRAGYTPSSSDISKCADVKDLSGTPKACTAEDMMETSLMSLSGLSGEVGVRGLFTDANSQSTIPGIASEAIIQYNNGRFGAFVSGAYLRLNEWTEKAGDSTITRLANYDLYSNVGVHYNFSPNNNVDNIVRIGIIGSLADKRWDILNGDRARGTYWEAATYISGTLYEGLAGTMKLGASKPMDSDNITFLLSITPSIGSQLQKK